MLAAIGASIILVSLGCLVLLHRTAERYASLLAVLESTGDGILVVNAAGRIVGYNRRFADLWRVPESELKSTNAPALLAQVAGQLRDPDRFLHRVRELYSDREATADDLVELRDGRIYERHTEPQRFRGRIVGRVWRFHDVTEFRRAQARLEETKDAAESASRAKTEFLHNMSHEIRTPMNGVLGLLEIALDSELSAEQRENLGMAKMSAENLLAIVNDITDFSKIEAGKLEFDLVPFDLRDCVEKTAKSLALAAHQKNLEILCGIAESVPRFAVGDVVRLRQVLINLIGNAVKFTERGEVGIEVEGRSLQLQRNSLELQFAVRDSGIGISPENQRKIFESFSQADPSTTRLYGGSGLGLTISQRLVELMGGRIWVESEPGRGSTFRFTLPVRIDDTTKIKPDCAGIWQKSG